MDLLEENQLSQEIETFLFKKLKNKTFKAAIAIEDGEGDGFGFSTGNLTEKSAFRAWKIIVAGLTRETEDLVEHFTTPLNTKLNKPVEPK